MDEREVDGVLKWLDLNGQSREEGKKCIEEDPLRFFAKYLDTLPPHLSSLFAKVLSTMERGKQAKVRSRRRNWAFFTQPEELKIDEARKRDPLLYKTIMTTLQRRGVSAAPSSSRQMKGLIEPEEVQKQPRFASVVDRLDEEDVLVTLRRQQGRQTQQVDSNEEEEEEEEDSDEEGNLARLDEFKAEVLEKFVRGDPALPFEMYMCDFDDQWDTRPGIQDSQDNQERWFDEDD